MAFVSDKTASEGRNVSLLTDDSVHLRGTYWEPRESGNITLLAIHDFLSDRTAWKPYTAAFRSRGWGIFALDLRGHGESLRQDLRSDALKPLERDRRLPGPYPADVRAAVAWIARQAKTDPGRVAVLGVGLGADLAYAASAKGWGTASSVLFGLDDGRARELAGPGPFSPRSCYLLFGEKDAGTAVAASAFITSTSIPRETHVYADCELTGLELFADKFPETAARTIAWIERTC